MRSFLAASRQTAATMRALVTPIASILRMHYSSLLAYRISPFVHLAICILSPRRRSLPSLLPHSLSDLVASLVATRYCLLHMYATQLTSSVSNSISTPEKKQLCSLLANQLKSASRKQGHQHFLSLHKDERIPLNRMRYFYRSFRPLAPIYRNQIAAKRHVPGMFPSLGEVREG